MSEPASGPGLRLIAGIDLTERSANAFTRAVDLGRSEGSTLTLLHVTSDALPSQVAGVHEAYATGVLDDLVEKARKDGAGSVRPVLVRGRDYETLIEQAHGVAADLVIIGTHRPSSFMQDMLGTTADRVLRYGGFPVLLVREKAAGSYNSVLVAVDFSSASRRAMELAVRWFPDAQISAVTAYGTSRRSHLGDGREAGDAAAETHRLALKGFLDEVAGLLDERGKRAIGQISPVVGRGWAEDVILRAAEEQKPDLIIVGTHARGGLQRAVLGSVAEWVLTEAPCDVLAVPPMD